jgi:formylglycine-generating enzyme required for sulfatase activity
VSSASDVRGLAIITVLVVGVAGFLYTQTPVEATVSPPAPKGPDTRAELPELVVIPAGEFLMGSDSAADPVDLDVFYIARHETTVAQFRAFVGATNFRVDPKALEGEPELPVGNVSWPDALAYCRWLETTLRESPHAPAELARRLGEGWHVSLPSEAEWEKAARGTDGRIFPWGNEPRRDRANYRSTSRVPVGSFPCPECPFGLADMSGNVWELTRSPFDEASGNVDLDADALFVMRGGSYADSEENVRAAVRGGADPGVRRPFIGFRVVITRLARLAP